jgi:hypothetical protein
MSKTKGTYLIQILPDVKLDTADIASVWYIENGHNAIK